MWRDEHRVVGLLADDLPNNHEPADRPTLVAPRLIELCFQTAGVWEIGVEHRLGLPRHVDHVRLWSAPAPGSKVYAAVTPDRDAGTFDAEIVDASGNRYMQISGYGTVALDIELAAEPLKVLQAAAD